MSTARPNPKPSVRVPAYRDLPLSPTLGLPCAWDVFGRDDSLGTLNFIGSDSLAEGTECIRWGKKIPLSLPLDQPNPGMFWRTPPEHTVLSIDRNTLDDQLNGFYPQGSSHWDGFLHVRAGADGFYSGLEDEESAGEQLGIHHWSGGIIGRGVLADVSGTAMEDPAGCPDYEISVDELERTLSAQGTRLSRGSVLCIRTGWMDYFLCCDVEERARISSAGRFPGLRADRQMSEFLWDNGIAAIAADNPAVEVAPGSREIGSLHRQSLIMTGLPFGELFTLEALTAHCRTESVWDFMFVSVPLHLKKGVGSPANAVAIV